MKKDIILAGVGGQGILTIAAIIGSAAINAGLHLKQAEVHGMSQRGGDVQSNLRISDQPIHSDLIPYGKADLIISVEPMESLRYLPLLSPEGWLVTNTTPHVNIPDYPQSDAIEEEIKKIKQHVLIDANSIAKELGLARSANMVVLGAATPFLELDYEWLKNAIRQIFGRKGEDVVNQNFAALDAGRSFADQSILS